MQEKISRRNFITAAGATAALTATAALGFGCSPKKEEPSAESKFDFSNNFLPLGSVVTVSTFPEWAKLMIVMRRPTSTVNSEGTPDATGNSKAGWDYGGVLWPYSFMGNLAEETLNQEVYPFMCDKIVEVNFLGYQDDKEEEVVKLLNEKMSSHLSGFDILSENCKAFQDALAAEK